MMFLSILFGTIVGLSLGLTGGGGASFAVPMLTYGLGQSPREAVTISLISVGITAFIGFLQKWHNGEAEIRTGLLLAIAGMAGAPAGSWIARQVPEAILMLLFAGLMITIATQMWLRSRSAPTTASACTSTPHALDRAAEYRQEGPSCQRDGMGNLIVSSRCARLLLLIGLATGILTGLFGVGGGFIIVPALMVLSGMSMSHAVGTSLMIISLVSISGIASQLATGQTLPFNITAAFVVGGLGGLTLGQMIGHRLAPVRLQRIFAVAILLVAVLVVVKNLF